MKQPDPRRRARQSRPLPYASAASFDEDGPRSLFCLDMRVVEVAWTQRSLEEIRSAARGGRLAALFGELDLDPRRSLQRNARTLMPERAQQIFDALCEELAERVLYDVPRRLWLALLPLLAPHGTGESPYPADGTLPQGEALRGGMVVLSEGRLSAESAAVALSQALYPPRLPGEAEQPVDPVLWSTLLAALQPMLEAVRDQGRALLIEA